jgi:hypothetical protein
MSAQTISEAQIQSLVQSDEDQLLEVLGMRSAVVSQDLGRSADPNLSVAPSDLKAMGIKDDLKALGRRILRRWNRSAYQIACGSDPEDSKARSELTKALGIGEAAAIGVLTGALIGVGLMAALAPVVSAILVKKFFNPAYGEFCAYWKEKLDP